MASNGGRGYGDQSYWDQRYAQDDKYDWYLNYHQFKQHLLPHLNVLPSSSSSAAADVSNSSSSSSSSASLCPPSSRSSLRLLVVGCGNSELSKMMFDDGFTDIESIDYSTVVIDQMQQNYKDIPELKFTVMDVREMSLPSESYDAIIDKGTLDAILCGSDSSKNATAMLSECYRLLKPGVGVLLIITYGQPATRLCYLEQSRFQWEVSTTLLEGNRYMYSCHKLNEEQFIEKNKQKKRNSFLNSHQSNNSNLDSNNNNNTNRNSSNNGAMEESVSATPK